MKNRSILDSTSNLLHTVGGGMFNVSYLLQSAHKDTRGFEKIIEDSRVIENKYQVLNSFLTKSYYFIIDDWNSIKENQMRLFEVSDFMNSCLSFRTNLLELEKSCAQYKGLYPSYSDNDVTLAEYFLMMRDYERKFERIFSYVSNHIKEEAEEVSLFAGISAELKEYISGGNDLVFERLICEHIPPGKKMKWIGQRNEATLFGEYFGLPCKLMNDSFIFHSRSNGSVCLHYSRDHFRNDKEFYTIYAIISKYQAKK